LNAEFVTNNATLERRQRRALYTQPQRRHVGFHSATAQKRGSVKLSALNQQPYIDASDHEIKGPESLVVFSVV